MASSGRNRLGSSSAASTSSQSSDSEQIDSNVVQGSSSLSDLKRIYEQRRIRHIVCILVRNLEIPDAKTSRQRQTPLRPTAHRSISITSNHSTHTLKRTPSNRTLRASVRRRASSVASIPHADDEDENQYRPSRTYQPPSLFLPWDTDSLRRSIHARFTHAFVSFADTKTSRIIYRTPVTRQSGLHHAWGSTSGSDIESDGIDLSQLTNEDGSQNHLHISLWGATRLAVESLSAEHNFKRIIAPGSEESNGFQLIWERDVSLEGLNKVEKELSNISLTLPENSMILGMRLPLAQVHVTEIDSEEQTKDVKPRDDKGKTGISKSGSVTQYYVLLPQPNGDQDLPLEEEEVPLEKGLIRKLLKDGTLKRGYDIADILQILQLQRQILEEKEKIDNAGSGSSSILAAKQDSGIHRIVQLGEDKERQRVLLAKRDATREIVKQKKREIHDRNEALHRRRARLEIARRLLTNRQKVYEELRKKMTQLSKVRLTIEAKIYARRVVMLRQVEYIYPIDLIDGAELLFGIVDIPLMNRDGNEDNRVNKEKRSGARVDQSDDIVSSALGMVGQMVALISAYTDAPLHYPIATAGSRSVIQDGISVMSGPRAFPLYSKGVERYRYEYGHFLLNKDIEQLMNHAGITILDIRNTLPNLKNLIVTLTASSQVNSKLSRRHHIGSEMISLPNTKAEGLGIGRPTGTANDKHQQGDQIGYGAVVENQSILGHSKRSTAGSRWGMSLLGWGSSTNGSSNQYKLDQQISNETTTQSTLPTVRTLGRSG